MRRLLRIDLANKAYRYEDMTDVYANLVGRGRTSRIVGLEVPPIVDPLDKTNKLVFAAGILAGTVVSNNGRLSAGGKSPLTNGTKQASAGGSAAQKLARPGIQGVVVEGRATGLSCVNVTKDSVPFTPADSLKATGNYETIEKLKSIHGEHACFITIGSRGGVDAQGIGHLCNLPRSRAPDGIPRRFGCGHGFKELEGPDRRR
jgi:aldehyde:ferredoxin oxidoreductase